jgi:hypothetical protein
MQEIEFIEKITSWSKIRYYFYFFTLNPLPAALLHPPCQEALGHIGLSKKDICRAKIVLVTSAMSD